MKKKEFHDFKTIKDKVEYLLLINPLLRDNDMKLIATYYFHEIGKEEIDRLSAYDLLTKLSTSKIANFESIRRSRMQLQQKSEELRGSEYLHRKKKFDVEFVVFLRE